MATEWAPEGRFQVFLISLSGFRAPFFRTQDSVSLDPLNVALIVVWDKSPSID